MAYDFDKKFGLNKLQYVKKDVKKQSFNTSNTSLMSNNMGKSVASNNIVEMIWEYYRTNEIIQYVGKWVGRTFSNLELTIEYGKQGYNLAEISQTTKNILETILGTFRTYNGSQQELLMSIGTNMAVAGEVYLIPIKDNYGSCYFVANRSQIKTEKKDRISFQNVPQYVIDNVRRTENGEYVVYQIIDLMPGTADVPDSWLVGAESVLCQYETMRQSVQTALLSQINAPILVYPSEVEIEQPNMVDGINVEVAETATQYLDQQFMDRFQEAVEQEDPYSRLLPFVLGLPSDSEKLYTLNLHRNIDPALLEGLKHAFHNILLAAPIPQENILGLGDSNHWDNAQITKDSFQKCIKPYADLVVGSLSAEILKPFLLENGVSDVDRFVLTYDSSPIVIPQDKTSEAMNQFSKGLISLNEAREMMGKPKIDGIGDMFYFQLYSPTVENKGKSSGG